MTIEAASSSPIFSSKSRFYLQETTLAFLPEAETRDGLDALTALVQGDKTCIPFSRKEIVILAGACKAIERIKSMRIMHKIALTIVGLNALYIIIQSFQPKEGLPKTYIAIGLEHIMPTIGILAITFLFYYHTLWQAEVQMAWAEANLKSALGEIELRYEQAAKNMLIRWYKKEPLPTTEASFDSATFKATINRIPLTTIRNEIFYMTRSTEAANKAIQDLSDAIKHVNDPSFIPPRLISSLPESVRGIARTFFSSVHGLGTLALAAQAAGSALEKAGENSRISSMLQKLGVSLPSASKGSSGQT